MCSWCSTSQYYKRSWTFILNSLGPLLLYKCLQKWVETQEESKDLKILKTKVKRRQIFQEIGKKSSLLKKRIERNIKETKEK